MQAICNILTKATTCDFMGTYNSTARTFNRTNKYITLTGTNIFIKSNWPDKPGVYVVWKVKNNKKEVVYIGMTGKYKYLANNTPPGWGINTTATSSKLSRFSRWTPYTPPGWGINTTATSSKLNDRFSRWTPYSFSWKHSTKEQDNDSTANFYLKSNPVKNTDILRLGTHFCYGVIFDGNGNQKNNVTHYNNCIPAEDLRVDCFICDTTKIAPSFLEALFLQAYLTQHEKLPAANQEF